MTTESTQVSAPPASPEAVALNASIDAEDGANKEPQLEGEESDKPTDPPKKEESEAERETRRLRRKMDRLLQQRAELRAELRARSGSEELTPNAIERDNHDQQSDNETLSLSRKELTALIEQEAKKLAPQIKQRESEIERRGAIVGQLAKEWGQEKFDALASDLDDAFGGLTDANGRPKPAADAIFESDAPKALIEYLADPDHADEAEAIGRMSAVQAARAITRLELKLAAEQANAKPQPSKVPPPIEAIRGKGGVNTKRLADMSDDEFIKRRREQIARRR